jgi:hypothetical protein
MRTSKEARTDWSLASANARPARPEMSECRGQVGKRGQACSILLVLVEARNARGRDAGKRVTEHAPPSCGRVGEARRGREPIGRPDEHGNHRSAAAAIIITTIPIVTAGEPILKTSFSTRPTSSNCTTIRTRPTATGDARAGSAQGKRRHSAAQARRRRRNRSPPGE